ncbi:MAG: aldose epimerase family protein [Allomuricauda sp.]
MKTVYFAITIGLTVLNFQCRDVEKREPREIQPTKTQNTTAMERKEFGATPEGKNVEMYTLKNSNGMEVDIISFGGIITALRVPDKEGKIEDVVLGFNTLDSYLQPQPFFGAIIGRYGNRIANGKFSIDRNEYTLAKNNGPNHLHGGNMGFDKAVWNITPKKGNNSVSLKLDYLSKDMEEGYPGNLKTSVTYTLTNDNVLDIVYSAATDKATVVNLTQHSYFNLSGDFSKSVEDHEITILADGYLPTDASLIPTGEIAPVEGTPFDFNKPKPIGKDINLDHEHLRLAGGYDHNWVLNDQEKGYRWVAKAYHPGNGRTLEVFTDEPGMQFYTGNFLDGTLPSKNGGTYTQRAGFCFETQHYPDSPNQEQFPSTVLRPGEIYSSRTSFKFSVEQ